jgi:hypothetical protein
MEKITWFAGALCALLSTVASADTSVSSIKACGGEDTGLGRYIQPIKIPSAKAAGGFKCHAPSTYVEIVAGKNQVDRFCTAKKGLIPGNSGKSEHSAYRIDLLSYMKSRAPSLTQIAARKTKIEEQLGDDQETLINFDAAWKAAHGADGLLLTGAVFALSSKIPAKYHRKDGQHIGILESIKNYKSSIEQEMANLRLEQETYAPGKLSAMIEESASNFSMLAQLVLSQCPNDGKSDGPIQSCHSDPGSNSGNATAESLSAALSIVKDHDDKLIGTDLVRLRTESLFEQGHLSTDPGPQEQYLACNDLLQTFGVTRFGCKDSKSGTDCRILADGAVALDPSKVVAGQTLNDSLFGKLPDALAAEGAAEGHVKAQSAASAPAAGRGVANAAAGSARQQ